MTDELAIQAVNPQVKRKDNTTPYAFGGAAIGAVAGGLSPIGVTKQKYSSYEDILKESNDTFEKNINKGGDNKSFWETAKQHKEAVDKAGEEWENKVKEIKESHKSAVGELPDCEAKRNLEEAQKAYDAEFKKLVEQEKRSLERGGRVTSLPTAEEMRLGIKGSDAEKVTKDWNYYNNTLKSEYENSVNKVKTDAKASGNAEYKKAESSLNSYKSSLEGYYNDVADAVAEKDPKKKTQKERSLETKISNIVEKEYPYPNNDQIKEKAFREGNMVERKGRLSLLGPDYIDPKTGKEYVFKNGVKLKVLRKAEETKIDTLRESLANEIKASNSEYAKAKAEMKAFEGQKEFRRLSRKLNPNTEFVCELSEINGKNAVETYKKEAEIMEKLADPKRAKKVSQAEIDALRNKYGLEPTNINDYKKITTQIQKRLSLAEQYAEKAKAITDAMGGQSRITAYKEAMEKAINSNDDVRTAANKIKKLAKCYGINVENVAGDEIIAKAEQNAKQKIDSTVAAQTLKDMKQRAEEAAEKFGLKAKDLTQEELEKILKDKGIAVNKEEAVSKAKTAAKEALEKDLSKIKGPNRWVNAAIAAIALGLGGYAVASSKKN